MRTLNDRIDTMGDAELDELAELIVGDDDDYDDDVYEPREIPVGDLGALGALARRGGVLVA